MDGRGTRRRTGRQAAEGGGGGQAKSVNLLVGPRPLLARGKGSLTKK